MKCYVTILCVYSLINDIFSGTNLENNGSILRSLNWTAVQASETPADTPADVASGVSLGGITNILSGLVSSPPQGSEESAGAVNSVIDFLTSFAQQSYDNFYSSQSAREKLVLPAYEKLGRIKDYFGVESNVKTLVKVTYARTRSVQVPIERLARELFSQEDPYKIAQILDHVATHPVAKAVVRSYAKREPERKMAQAVGSITDYAKLFRELHQAIKHGIKEDALGDSLVITLDMKSAAYAEQTARCLATVCRYLTYVDRFQKNKSALLFVSKTLIPRILHAYALQLNIINTLWSYGIELEDKHSSSSSSNEVVNEDDVYDLEKGDYIAEYKNPAQKEDAYISFYGGNHVHQHVFLRKYCRRLLARIRNQIDALHAISQAALSATDLNFQVEFAKALRDVDRGVSPKDAFEKIQCLYLDSIPEKSTNNKIAAAKPATQSKSYHSQFLKSTSKKAAPTSVDKDDLLALLEDTPK